MEFKTFFGNEELKKTVFSRINSGSFPHAVILEGERGIGKKTLARLIAAALLCESSNKPCGECLACRQFLSGNHPDYHFYEKDKKSTFSVSLVREIRSVAFIVPNQSDRAVFVVSDAVFMNEQAQNAFLKILEEPPRYAYFILLCEERSKMLATVLSRCTVFTLQRLDAQQALSAVRDTVSGPEDEEIRKTIGIVGGNVGEVISALQGNREVYAHENALEIARAVAERDEYELLKAFAEYEGKKHPPLEELYVPLKQIFRDALALSCGGEALIAANAETAALLSDSLTKKQLLEIMGAVDNFEKDIKNNMSAKLLMSLLCSQLITLANI